MDSLHRKLQTCLGKEQNVFAGKSTCTKQTAAAAVP
jgi:hypothetical protein